MHFKAFDESLVCMTENVSIKNKLRWDIDDDYVQDQSWIFRVQEIHKTA